MELGAFDFNEVLLLFQKQERSDRLKGRLEKHLFHINKLEAIMRLVDNDALQVDQVGSVFITQI